MYLERLLQINMAMLASLGALLLGMGQRDRVTPLAMLILATAAVVLVDIKQVFRLNRTAAGAAAFLAVAVAFLHTRQLEGESLLLAIANLLVLLQAILLFQPKDDRIYSQLAVLCLLEAVVSTLFAQGVLYGALLCLEMLLGMIALALMHLVRNIRPCLAGGADAPLAAETAARRWPLAGRKAAFQGVPAGSPRAAFGPELIRRLASISAATAALSVLVFLGLPRFGESAWEGVGAAAKRLVGFNDKITLGEMGESLVDPAEIMQVRLLPADGGEALAFRGDIYLRGTILEGYQRGLWRQAAARAAMGLADAPEEEPMDRDKLPPSVDKVEVLQEIVIEPLDRPELFCIWPPSAVEPNYDVLFDARNQKFERNTRACRRRFMYTLGCSAFRDRQQSPLTPCSQTEGRRAEAKLLAMPELPRTKALAADWLSKVPMSDRFGRALRLEVKLRNSPLFRYSLQGQPRNAALDPIEDFVSEHRQGHCEYFASALCMMLRSQGIPARIVVGFHTDEFDAANKLYRVRHLHAHSWVEAHLRPEDLPPELRTGDIHGRFAGGGWLRLDSTPSGEDISLSLGERLSAKLNWLRNLWDSYVVEMNRRRQVESIYEPLLDRLRAAWRCLSDPAWWSGLADSILGALGIAWGGAGRAALLALAALLLGLAVFAAVWWVRRMFRRRGAGVDGHRGWRRAPEAIQVEFYARFEALLARRGLARLPRQTPREFAAAAANMPQAATLGVAPEALVQVAECYYQVRFGGHPLDNPQRETVEQVLSILETPPPAKEHCHVS